MRTLGIVLLLIPGILIPGFVAWLQLPTKWPATATVTSPSEQVKEYYLDLGDSLAFGYQPNLDWAKGYSMQWWPELQKHGSKHFNNLACMQESTDTFIHGDCPYSKFRHDYYDGPQLKGATDFLEEHSGDVSPVSLSIGWEDISPDLHPDTCKVDVDKFNQDLANMDKNLTKTILPKLIDGLTDDSGKRTGNLVMLGYYDPYVKRCPRFHSYVEELNDHLARDADRFDVPFVNLAEVFDFAHERNLCDYTWACGTPTNTNPNAEGYRIITQALEKRMGY